MGPFGKKKSEDETPRKARRQKENEILEANRAKFPFHTITRFVRRVVAKEDGQIRESGYMPDRVYWITEALDEDSEEESDG